MITVTNEMICDIRTLGCDLGNVAEIAKKQNKQFILFNGIVYDAHSMEEVFFPEFGFWIAETMPFIGWKIGYEYSGTNKWLLGQDVPCEMIDKIPA